MSLGKLPGIKGLVSGSQGKRRFKSELSVDMISPPLGDFRHTMHVGRGGEVFGDTSFLSNYGSSRDPGSPDSANSSKTTGFFTRTFRHVRKNSGQRPRGFSRDLSSPPPDISPIIKNAISLPQLNMDSPNGCRQRVLFPSSISSTDDSFCTYGLQSGFVTLPRLSRLDRQFQDGDIRKGSLPDSSGITLTRSDSLTSFTVDLGPSLMTEVLSLIDNPSCLQMSNHSQAAGKKEEGEQEEEEDDSSLTETPVQSPGATSPNPSMGSGSFSRIMNNRGQSCSSNWTEQEEERRSLRTPDMSAGSPQREEPVMEAERFQKAADVLSRHYGGGSFTKGTRISSNTTSPAVSHSSKTSYAFSEEEEEIKV
ncbi:cdc42 effector protein 1-like [Siniperca chuatsi]|uniref:cdc42 effector protein 1-like n=1 Tax=Siniperca chuatsi TaxID=119488 RepID=UPI001CE1BAE7|nr:cdc42 effector protein 1-like [Siniperca chuatsi]XP_044036685.1 cdc42 effector protein 1-like [Siniperca chuatsi]XP_044036686.1 cdc42 effector protein 1-like [Siniperca chuatsi]XP_044036687.1 cdc42 effector protein 1-like [Siniperca chuatsi]XP_044036688.1 cdc42 effector protein 1-like [Siniperca chuatsi]